MRRTNHSLLILIGTLIISAGGVFGGIKLQVRNGRPVVDGVFVNGQGPYRFLLDTGANINLIETGLAGRNGMKESYQIDLGSAGGAVRAAGSDGNEIDLGPVKADRQRFLYVGADALRAASPDVQGVLGQWFLARFDYRIDLAGMRIEFGGEARRGVRCPFKMINARPVISTSLGELVLDSGASHLTLFGTRTGGGGEVRGELRTVAGSQRVLSGNARLVIDGRRLWEGDALVIPDRREQGLDGLLPLSLWKAVYVSNSEGYVVFEN
jgi:hypothetical protein